MTRLKQCPGRFLINRCIIGVFPSWRHCRWYSGMLSSFNNLNFSIQKISSVSLFHLQYKNHKSYTINYKLDWTLVLQSAGRYFKSRSNNLVFLHGIHVLSSMLKSKAMLCSQMAAVVQRADK